MCVWCVCVCVCVCEKERVWQTDDVCIFEWGRDTESETKKETKEERERERERERVCVCVCEGEREIDRQTMCAFLSEAETQRVRRRARERERERERLSCSRKLLILFYFNLKNGIVTPIPWNSFSAHFQRFISFVWKLHCFFSFVFFFEYSTRTITSFHSFFFLSFPKVCFNVFFFQLLSFLSFSIPHSCVCLPSFSLSSIQ